ncbi:hypothetical protein [Streptomyces sp. RKAG337]|uniref:hypothetical protein n=1 Tax=Streptomyces sp. RKAG337 TaxID=2893404 RepID=UPI0027E46487|nr:hypothetical protein [Streptomyces sp. RKAG337]
MTQTPTGSGIPAAQGYGAPPAPRVPQQPVRPPAAPPPPPPRRRAWSEGADRLRAAATTEPGRLRIIGAVLAVLVVAFGAVTAWQITDRASAASDVVNHSAPLSAKAAEIYRSLADADTTASGGFLIGGQQPKSVTDRYDADLRTASKLIAEAAGNAQGSATTLEQISLLNQQLKGYTEAVANAGVYNRQGYPVGGAYLRYANELMRQDGGLLDTADKLYKAETARLGEDYGSAKALPWLAWSLGAIALGALLWAQRRSYRRTNRVFNQGMLAASAASVVVLLWAVVGHTVAASQLDTSYDHGAKSLQVLNSARIGVLQARGDENLTLVARGSGASYETNFQGGMSTLAGKDPKGVGGEMAQALALADDEAGRGPVNDAIKGVQAWRGRHTAARASDNEGNYADAVAQVIGGKNQQGEVVSATTGQCFDAVDASLRKAVDHEQQEFEQAANDGRGALTGLPAGAALLAVLAAAGAALGIGRRLSEYR